MNYGRALITGGAGLVGSHIADLLAAEDLEEIVVLDNFSRGRQENLRSAARRCNLTVIEGDIRDKELVDDVREGVDVVFHQAAIRATQCAENPRMALEVLADGTFNILEAAVRAGVKKIVAGSCASVYGLVEEFPTPESHHGYDNRTIDGAMKLFNEGLLRSFHHQYGLQYVALRYFGVYGPRMDTYGVHNELLFRWIECLDNAKPCLILGGGTQTMDFVFVEDVARANLLAAKAQVTDEVFNIASGVETSLSELAQALGRVMGRNIPPEYGPARKITPVPRCLADTRKAKQLLGFKARISLEEGHGRLVEWWKRQRPAPLAASAAR
jgi:UDP-glucose 4-epimerase